MDEAQIREQLNALLDKVQSMQMATHGEQGQPVISYAPFVMFNNRFYLFLSQLAKHTGNLERQPGFSFMLIEDEADCKQPFARRRMSCNARAGLVEPDSALYREVLEAFEQRFGNVINLLKGLADFRLFEVSVENGSLVLGFGQAYSFEGEEYANLLHLRENR